MKVALIVAVLCLASGVPSWAKPKQVSTPWKLSSNADDIPWTDCSEGKSVVKVKSLKVSPSTIHIPGQVVLEGATVEVPKTIAGPIKVVYEVKFGGIFPVPCSKLGGHDCTIDDICPLLQNLTCPKYIVEHGLPCHCPFAAGTYNFPAFTIPIPKPPQPLPSLVNNKFNVQAKATDAQGNSLLCIDATVTLHADTKYTERWARLSTFLTDKNGRRRHHRLHHAGHAV